MPRSPRRTAFVVLGTRLVGDGGGDLAHQRLVEGGGHADRLREDRRRAGSRDTVEALVPPVVGGDAEPLDGRGGVHELRDLLLHRHSGDQVCRTLLEAEAEIQVRGLAAGGLSLLRIGRPDGGEAQSRHQKQFRGRRGSVRGLLIGSSRERSSGGATALPLGREARKDRRLSSWGDSLPRIRLPGLQSSRREQTSWTTRTWHWRRWPI